MSLTSREFRNPSNWWRSAPFWSWNYLLTPEKIRAQAAELIRSGMGGYFCHSRWGLETPYLSRDWMDCIKAALAEAKKRGGYCWLYDEDRWPSGAAGGLVTIPHPEYRMRLIVAEWPPERQMPPASVGGRLDRTPLGRYAAVERNFRKIRFRALAADEWPARGEQLLVISRLVCPDSEWYNRGAYLDTMNPEAVRAFIAHTYEGYRKAVGREFGRAVPGIFTDEPNYFQLGSTGLSGFNFAPWTDRLPEEFRRRCGYDLGPELPLVFYDVAAARSRGLKVRRDFHLVCAELFEEAFSRQIGAWCGRHRIAFTGHYLAEETLESQAKVVGAAMPHYRHQQLPGIDILGRRISEVLTCKQVSSMAEQFGKPRVLSELYGGAGWHFSLADQKWMGDWQYALGVNLRCQHLVLTSLRGGTKRDYPPSFFPQTPWWKHNRAVEDYFGRLSCALAQGRAVRDLLVIHPVESAWALRTAKRDEPSFKKLGEMDKRFAALLGDLLALHRDYDLGDESVLAGFGRVAGGELAVGRGRYQAVLVPECLTLRRTTLRLLAKFAASGGKVLWLRPGPGLLEGSESAEPLRVLRRAGEPAGAGRAALGRALDRALPKLVAIRQGGAECGEVIYMLRRDAGRRILFLANTDFDRPHAVDLALFGGPGGAAEEWDLASGRIRRAAGAVRASGAWRLKLELPPAGSRLLVFGPPSGRARPEAPRLRTVGRTELAPAGWRFRRDEPNALVLDLCRCRVRDGEFSAPTNLRLVDAAVRRELGYPAVHNGGVMRWKAYPLEDLKRERRDGPRVELEFEFLVKQPPRGRFALALERPGRFEVRLNGRPVAGRPDGCFVDESLETVPLPAPRRGRNRLTLVTGFRPEHELEDVFLVGDFGVAATRGRELIAEPRRLRRDPWGWVRQGYAHYGGAITYLADFEVRRPGRAERVFVATGAPAGTALEVRVNGRRTGVVPWAPWEVEVTGGLRAGRNRLELTVVGSRRNLMGPLHRKPPDPWMIGPGSFPAPAGRERRYTLLPQGLAARVWLENRAVGRRP